MKAIVLYNDNNRQHTGLVCDSAMTRAKDPFFVPAEGVWHGMVLRGVRIDRLGKGIEARFADRYYSEILSAVHSYADADTRQIERWGRDGALVVGDTATAEQMDEDLKKTMDHVISDISTQLTLKTGDLVLIADPENNFEFEDKSKDYIIEPRHGCPGLKFKVR